jgi:ribosome-binding protein aMBF1 (putative translation factor)
MITEILSRGRVALLSIAQRQISIEFSHTARKQKNAKPLPASIKTIGDLIQVKRHEKNLTLGHLAAKMGIATALVRSWEDGTGQPDNRQLKVLAGLLGVDAEDYGCDDSTSRSEASGPSTTPTRSASFFRPQLHCGLLLCHVQRTSDSQTSHMG